MKHRVKGLAAEAACPALARLGGGSRGAGRPGGASRFRCLRVGEPRSDEIGNVARLSDEETLAGRDLMDGTAPVDIPTRLLGEPHANEEGDVAPFRVHGLNIAARRAAAVPPALGLAVITNASRRPSFSRMTWV